MNTGQRLTPAATIVMVSLLLLATAPDNANGRQVFSKDPQPSSARQNNGYYNNIDPSAVPSFIDTYLDSVLNSHAITSFSDKLLAKFMGGLLAVNLLAIAAIASLAWMFVICALKPGCPVYNWREVGPRSRHSRLQRDDDEAPLHPVM